MKKRYFIINGLILLLLLISQISAIAVADDDSISLIGEYGGSGTELAFQGLKTLDGGYVLVGTTDSYGNGGFDYWLVKTDKDGLAEWNKYYGGVGDDAASCVFQTSDNGFILAGYSNSFADKDFDFLLIKTNNTGEIEWSKNYGGIKEDRCRWLTHTVDGGYALAGYSNSFSNNGYDYLLIKTDEKGDIQWYKTYGNNNTEKANYLIQSDDGGFLIVGETNSFGAGNYDFWVVKTDRNGSMEWNRTFGGQIFDHAQAAVQSDDGGFLIVGETNSFGAGNYDFWVVKTDRNGSMEWNRTFGWKNSDHAQAVVQTDDGGFLISGYSEHLLTYDFQLFKIDKNGYLQLGKNYSWNTDIFANSIVQTYDNEYLLTGFILLEYPNMDFFMLKTNISDYNNTNLYPLADAGFDEFVEVNEKVFFNATGFDPDGEIIKYRWDFDGDGRFDWESNTSSQTTHYFSKGGCYKSYLEVTDNNNTKDIDMKIILVNSTADDKLSYDKEDSIWFYFLVLGVIIGILIILLFLLKPTRKKILNNSILKKIYNLQKNKGWYYYLFLTFFILLISKFIISLLFNKPYIYSDEIIYGVVANNLFHGNLMIFGDVPFSPTSVPVGYPCCLTPAYIFIDDMNIVYHVFLIINSILTSLVIFPVFFIMRKFVDEKKSFITSILVATLPIVLSVNFAILSENLFFLLFLISCFLIIQTFTYSKLDKWFLFLAILTGFSVGLLIMTRALGIAALGGLICVFLFKILKNRKLSNLKYSLVFLPFIPAIIIGYLIYSEKLLFIGYKGSVYIDSLGLIISSPLNILKFLRLIGNEINYFIIMSYVIFMAFTIFLIYHRKKIMKKKREKLSTFLIYSLCSIFFLIILTTIHIFTQENMVYSRYVSPGLPIIFMLGVIGLNRYMKMKNKNKYFQLSSIIVILSFIYVILFPYQIISEANNLDLVWIKYLKIITIFNINMLQIILVFILLLISFGSILIIHRWIKQKRLLIFERILKKTSIIFILTILLSLLFFIPDLDSEIAGGGGPEVLPDNIIARWFMKNDADTKIIFEDVYSAFSGGGIENERWHFTRINMHFWLPKSKITVMNREDLGRFILSKNTSADYIVSTHDLTQYYQLIEGFYLDIWVWPIKKQPYVDWHIYKIQ
ncbi:MAG: glycosyltransferase family 39 protein [Thermoplasmatales archaeon]|nr:glycosyltransferase family 39 protein [Thermoplasmatales archaeon]